MIIYFHGGGFAYGSVGKCLPSFSKKKLRKQTHTIEFNAFDSVII